MAFFNKDKLADLIEKYPRLPLLIPIFLALVLSWPHFNERLMADSCNYLDIGANLASGKGYLTTILTWFVEPSKVTHSALIEKQPLFPMFLAGFIYFFGMYRIVLLKVFLFALYVLSIFLTYEWVRKAYRVKPAFFSALYLAANPIMQIVQLDILNYSLFIFLLVLGIYLYLRFSGNFSVSFLGVITGLAYLTRLEGSLVFIFFCGCYLMAKKWRQLIILILAFSITISPLFIARKIKYNDFTKSIHEFQYRTLFSPNDAMWFYDVELYTFKELLKEHKKQIFEQIILNIKNYGGFFFGPYGLFIFFAAIFFFRPRYFNSIRETHLFYLFFLWLLSLLLHWPRTHIFDRSYLTSPLIFIITPVYVVLLEAVAREKLSNWLKSMTKYVMPLVIITTIMVNQVYARPFVMDWSAQTVKRTQAAQPLVAWIEKTFNNDDIICSEDYYLINYYTRRPTVALPWNLNPNNIENFLRDYPAKAVIFNRDFPEVNNMRGIATIKKWRLYRVSESNYQAFLPPPIFNFPTSRVI